MSMQFITNKSKIHGFYRESDLTLRELAYSHFHLRTPSKTTARLIINKGPYNYIPKEAKSIDVVALTKDIEEVSGKYLLFACFIPQGIYVEDEDGNSFIYDPSSKTIDKAKPLAWRYV